VEYVEDRAADQPADAVPNQGPGGPGRPVKKPSDGLPLQLAIYSGLRIGLVVVVTLVLYFVAQMPVIVALLFAIIVQLPLSMILFQAQRRRVTDLVNSRSAVRRAQRDTLRQALRGDERQ